MAAGMRHVAEESQRKPTHVQQSKLDLGVVVAHSATASVPGPQSHCLIDRTALLGCAALIDRSTQFLRGLKKLVPLHPVTGLAVALLFKLAKFFVDFHAVLGSCNQRQ